MGQSAEPLREEYIFSLHPAPDFDRVDTIQVLIREAK